MSTRMQQFQLDLMRQSGPLAAQEWKLCLKSTFIDLHSPSFSDASPSSGRRTSSAPATPTAPEEPLHSAEEEYVHELSGKVWEVASPSIQPLAPLLLPESAFEVALAPAAREPEEEDEAAAASAAPDACEAPPLPSGKMTRMQEFQRGLMRQGGQLPTQEWKLCLNRTFIDLHSPVDSDYSGFSGRRSSTAPATPVAPASEEAVRSGEEQYVQKLSEKVWELGSPIILPLPTPLRAGCFEPADVFAERGPPAEACELPSPAVALLSAEAPARARADSSASDCCSERGPATKDTVSTAASEADALISDSAASEPAPPEPQDSPPPPPAGAEQREEAAAPRRCGCCPSAGSHGHSLGLCRFPCRFFNEQGLCPSGDTCGFCHMGHERRPHPLDRHNRDALAEMSPGVRLAFVSDILQERVASLGLGHEAEQLVAAWKSEVCQGRRAPEADEKASKKKAQRRLAGALRAQPVNVLTRTFKNIAKDEEISTATDRLIESLRELA